MVRVVVVLGAVFVASAGVFVWLALEERPAYATCNHPEFRSLCYEPESLLAFLNTVCSPGVLEIRGSVRNRDFDASFECRGRQLARLAGPLEVTTDLRSVGRDDATQRALTLHGEWLAGRVTVAEARAELLAPD